MMSIKTVKQITTRQRNPRPTKAQVAALQKSLKRDGSKLLTYDEVVALSQHPNLTVGQRRQWSEQAAKMAVGQS